MIGRATAMVAALAAAPSSPSQPASPLGVWQAPIEHGVVQLYACGEALCGRVVTSDLVRADPELRDVHNNDPALRGRRIKGLTVFTGFIGGPLQWRGRVYDPRDGHTYDGMIRVQDARTLRLTGCLVFPLCLTQTWTRLE